MISGVSFPICPGSLHLSSILGVTVLGEEGVSGWSYFCPDENKGPSLSPQRMNFVAKNVPADSKGPVKLSFGRCAPAMEVALGSLQAWGLWSPLTQPCFAPTQQEADGSLVAISGF